MSTATPPKVLTTIGLVSHPRRNCDEVFTAIVGWVRARGARLIGLPEEAPPEISHADQVSRERDASRRAAHAGDGSCDRQSSRGAGSAA